MVMTMATAARSARPKRLAVDEKQFAVDLEDTSENCNDAYTIVLQIVSMPVHVKNISSQNPCQ